MKVVRRRCAGRTSSAQVAGCAIVAVCAGMFAGSATADDQWMSEDAMRQTFAGVTLDGKYGSGRPFTETYDKDGRLEYRGVEAVIGGRWSVKAGTFCTIYDNDSTGGCFRVKQVAGNCYEFYFVARTEAQAQAEPGSPAWTARGHVVGKPGTCAEQHNV